MVLDLEEFVAAYIEAALWSSIDNNGDGESDASLSDSYYTEDIHPETMVRIRADCERFLRENEIDLAAADYGSDRYTDSELAGHDFWLTRNGHGAGFWDRDMGDVGDRLTKASHAFGHVDLYSGDDGLLYLT